MHDQCSGTKNEYFRRYLIQFDILFEEYKTDYSTRIACFEHSLKYSSSAYHFYQKLIEAETIGNK